jgi:hypothetical protein
MTGTLKSQEKIGDEFLKEGNYIALRRIVEMYAWTEERSSKSKTHTGGSKTTETTYTYKKVWTTNPEDSSQFKKPNGHKNLPLTLNNTTIKVKKAQIGIYDIDMSTVTLPSYQELGLTKNMLIEKDNFKFANNKYLFKGEGTLSNPEIGDIRISYEIITNPLEFITIFGKLDLANKKIIPFYGPKNKKLYRIFKGDRDAAISTMQTEHTVFTWILRLIGFLLMWFGLVAIFAPISTVLDVLPIFGSITRTGISIVTFIVALVLSIVTIVVSMIFHNIIALIIVILLAAGLGFLYFKKIKSVKTKPAK